MCNRRFFRNLNLVVSTSLMAFALLSLAQAGAQQPQKRRIAVMSLNVSPDAKQQATLQFGMHNDLGESLADLIINRLVADGKYTVIERAALDKIVKEQNFSNSDRADPTTAAKLGKIAGVDAIVIGSVTQFGGASEKQKINLGGLGGKLGTAVGMINSSKSTVSVGITARLIDVTTGAIIASATGTGMSTTSKTATSVGLTSYDTTSKDFSSTSIGDATTQAVTSVVAQIETAPMPTLAVATTAPPPPPAVARTSYKGVVADVAGNSLVLTVGTAGGARVGDTVLIARPGRKIFDPDNPKVVLMVMSDKLGEAKITEAQQNTSVATYTGTAPVKVKDFVTSQP